MAYTFRKYFSLILFLLTVILCSIAELLLVEIKFQPFNGGFLQSHQLVSISDKMIFILSTFLFNMLLYGILYLIWNKVLQKFKVHSNLIAFSFTMFFGIVTTVALVVQFQLHTYFADAMDAKLLKNIAGGSIRDALLYVLDELILFFAGVALLLAVYYILHRLFCKYFVSVDPFAADSYSSNTIGKTIFQIIVCIVISIPLVLAVNSDETLRSNLRRTNSYIIISSALNSSSDFDQDGYGKFAYPTDPKSFNATIYPGALDIPNNGIDEDGFFGDFETDVASLNSPIGTNYSLPLRPKHIVIIFMESARAEVVGLEIDGVQVSPNINNLAIEGISFNNAFSHTGFTTTSIASFFTGTLGEFSMSDSLFSILNDIGYNIAVFSGQDENFGENDNKLGTRKYADRFFDAQVGMSERVFASKLPGSIQISEATTWREFKRYSDGANWNTPQFVYYNMQAGHFPYYHGDMSKKFIDIGIPRNKINRKNREWLQNTYWNAIHYSDIHVGKVVNELKEKKLWNDTLFIVTADHGEELFDNGHLGHGFLTSDVQTRIPLLTNKKDFGVQEPVGHSDMKDYILQYTLENYGSSISSEHDNSKSVFQFVGTLDRPKKISIRYSGGQQIVMDIDNQLVRPIASDNWISFEDAVKQSDIERRLRDLVFHWERLRWQSHQKKVDANDNGA